MNADNDKENSETGTSPAEKFLKNARECESLAASASSPENKQALFDMAAMWRRLAEDEANTNDR